MLYLFTLELSFYTCFTLELLFYTCITKIIHYFTDNYMIFDDTFSINQYEEFLVLTNTIQYILILASTSILKIEPSIKVIYSHRVH